ncbi:DUF1285 domain-containing protein [Marinospirillum sp.]|uniref:DUF1285 domain-containing protein n=1 Tax=Marinospirillum sp. TaxID=2183934 RepID=UPI003A8AE1D2
MSRLQGLIQRSLPLAQETARPPVESWSPTQILTLDFFVDRFGQWFYEDRPFTRPDVARLLTRLLRREADGEYYLVTPTEKNWVRVEETPLLVIDCERQLTAAGPVIRCETQYGDWLTLDAAHPLRLVESQVDERADQPGERQLRPYITTWAGVEARWLTQVYYRMLEWAEEADWAGRPAWVLTSSQQTFLLAYQDADAC